MNALVVDDDRIVLHSCERVLSAEGFDVRVATSARGAMQALEARVPDVMIVDVKMPELDGMWLTREIGEKCPGVPVIVSSGYAVPEVAQQGLALGAADFLPKPFTPDELIASVRKALKKEHTHDSGPSSGD